MRPCARASSRLSSRQSNDMIEEELLDQDILPNSTSMTDKRLSSRHIRCTHIAHRVSYALPLIDGILDPIISSALTIRKDFQKCIRPEEASNAEDMA